MIAYITIIITAILGVIGLLYKTKKDDKPGFFNKLTPFGYGVLVLLIIALIVNIFSQREKDISAEKEKNRLLAKAQQDSMSQRSLFIIDSVGHKNTIIRLEEQRQRDSSKILEDSKRFKLTVLGFGEQLKKQNEALSKQGLTLNKQDKTLKNIEELQLYQDKTLRNIEELQHPLSPLKVHLEYTVYLSKLPVAVRKYLKKCETDLEKGSFDNKKYPSNFYAFPSMGAIEYNNFDPEDKSKYDSTFHKFHDFIYRSLMPDVWFYFYKSDTITKVDEKSSDLFLKSNGRDFRVSYKYYTVRDKVTFRVTFSDPIVDITKSNINSLYSIRNGLFIVRLVSYGTQYDCDKELKNLEFRAGPNYYDKYTIYFNEKDIIDITKYNLYSESGSVFYVKKGRDFLGY